MPDETTQNDAEQTHGERSEVRAADREDLPPADATPREANPDGYRFLDDVNLSLAVDLGSTTMTIRDILALEPGSVIELDRLAGEMMDVSVQGNYLGKGEVMVIADSLGVRLTELGTRQTDNDEEIIDQSDTG